jgi:hypothetical protein
VPRRGFLNLFDLRISQGYLNRLCQKAVDARKNQHPSRDNDKTISGWTVRQLVQMFKNIWPPGSSSVVDFR